MTLCHKLAKSFCENNLARRSSGRPKAVRAAGGKGLTRGWRIVGAEADAARKRQRSGLAPCSGIVRIKYRLEGRLLLNRLVRLGTMEA